MINLFCSLGNEYDSYESLKVNDDSVVYTSRQSLKEIPVTLSEEIRSQISEMFSTQSIQSYVDTSIGVNPHPGERHYDTRESFYLKAPQQNLELKFLLESPPSEQLRKLAEVFLVAFEQCRRRT